MATVAIYPAALRLEEAAKYCELSIDTFLKVCPMLPIPLAGGRWLTKRLDEWLYSLPIDWKAEDDENDFSKSEKLNGWIYIVGFLNYVKIGFTSKSSIQERIATLQTGCPEKLTVIASFKGSKQHEDGYHLRFAALNTQGEWFKREGELAAWIDGGCK